MNPMHSPKEMTLKRVIAAAKMGLVASPDNIALAKSKMRLDGMAQETIGTIHAVLGELEKQVLPSQDLCTQALASLEQLSRVPTGQIIH
jgi:hypothetical protein